MKTSINLVWFWWFIVIINFVIILVIIDDANIIYWENIPSKLKGVLKR